MHHGESIAAGTMATGRWRARGRALLRTLRRWHERSRQRRELLQLDARQRHDIGVTAEEARREARKPFWRA